MKIFLEEINKEKIYEYTLKNSDLEVRFINIGGTITDIIAPDKNGELENIVLKHKNYQNYITPEPAYLGALVGRVAGRIPFSKIDIGGKTYTLSNNNGKHTLHGGEFGFSSKPWEVEKTLENQYRLSYVSKDMEEGFPGVVSVVVTYTLVEKQLIIEYFATANKESVINLTNHTYFNLSAGKDLSKKHDFYLNSTHYLETDENVLATGKRIPSKNTFLDFSKTKSVERDFPKDGYDHCNILDENRDIKEPCAVLSHPSSGRLIKAYTDQPAMVFYTDGFAAEEELESGIHERFLGICLEAQKPNIGANGENLEMYKIDENTPYSQKTIYKFSLLD